jgi:transcriptional regulator with XRE-family HTH domain
VGMRGREFRRLRQQLGLTQAAFARQLGLHWNTVARLERGEMTISEPVARLAQLLAGRARRRPPTTPAMRRARRPGPRRPRI